MPARSHGQSGNRRQGYGAWMSMNERCTRPACSQYHNYGGRGITVDPAWAKSFEAFISDMGPRPSLKHSIERVDNSLGYFADNCIWADAVTQANNRRDNVRFTIHGVTRTQRQWCAIYNVNESMCCRRIKKGMTPLEALTTPTYRMRIITIQGVGKTVAEWLDHYGLLRVTYNKRLLSGLPEAEALSTPVRASPVITIGRESKPLAQWLLDYGVSCATYHSRLGLGWSRTDAITTPVRKKRLPGQRRTTTP